MTPEKLTGNEGIREERVVFSFSLDEVLVLHFCLRFRLRALAFGGREFLTHEREIVAGLADKI